MTSPREAFANTSSTRSGRSRKAASAFPSSTAEIASSVLAV
jgi:hypothetical protein